MMIRNPRRAEIERRLAEALPSARRLALNAEFLMMFDELGDPLTASFNYLEVARRLLVNGASAQDLSEILDKASAQAGRAGGIVRRMRAVLEYEAATPHDAVLSADRKARNA